MPSRSPPFGGDTISGGCGRGVFCAEVRLDLSRLKRSALNFFWVALCLTWAYFWSLCD